MTNEERYRAPVERAKAFRKFCISMKCAECECTKQRKTGLSLCGFAWLTLEAEEDKPLPCPCCGHEASIITDNDKGSFTVGCGACGCQLTRFSREHAIEAWNRRAK